MIEHIAHCPVCGNDQFSEHLNCVDHSISKETFQIKKCDQCTFLFTSPRPDKDSIHKYYESNDYISHSNASNNLINTLYKVARNFTLKQKIQLVNKYATGKNLLDYGCGTGSFLQISTKKGYAAKGIEPNHYARQLAIDHNLHAFENLTDVQNYNFEIITLWHVLEHIHDLNLTFFKLYDLLKDNGKFIIAVPNHDAKDANLYNNYWAAYDVPRHLYHFNQHTMAKFLNKQNLKLIDVIPMKLDAFYVCMLSEKYKGNYANLIKPFINACISNIYASNHNNNYSSLIYIAQK